MNNEHGTVSIVLATGALIVGVLSLGVADLGSLLGTRAHAQAAADAAALAAIAQQAPALTPGGDPEAAARAEAEANGARLVACDCRTGTAVATVDVEIDAHASFIGGWRRPVRARSRAELDPDVLTYRASG